MANVKYYPEDVLVEKVQSGEYGWLDYINHHSPEWQEEYTAFCKEKDLIVNEESAEEFLGWNSSVGLHVVRKDSTCAELEEPCSCKVLQSYQNVLTAK